MYWRSPSTGEEQIARNVQPFDVEPGKFTYRLVRAELEFEDYGTIEARCRINQDPHVTVPYTILPPPEDDVASFGAAISNTPTRVCRGRSRRSGRRGGRRGTRHRVFVSGHDVGAVEEIATAVRALLRPGVLAGCTAVGVIGNDYEAEEAPAISLWAGRVGKAEAVRLETVRAQREPPWSECRTTPLTAPAPSCAHRTLLVPRRLVDQGEQSPIPHLRIVGGVASADGGPGANRLILDGELHTDGAVGVLCRQASVNSPWCRRVVGRSVSRTS